MADKVKRSNKFATVIECKLMDKHLYFALSVLQRYQGIRWIENGVIVEIE